MERIPRFLIWLVVNDTYACENDKILNGLLKTELGFEGCAPALSQFLRLVLTAPCRCNDRLVGDSLDRIC
jgi:hypothetical protein